MKILIIARVDHNKIAGHIVTAISIGNSLRRKGCEISYVSNPNNILFRLYGISDAIIHNISDKKKVFGYIGIAKCLYNIINKEKYDAVITVDKASAYHFSIVSATLKIPMIPIIPIGGFFGMRPIPHSLTIVFTEENRDKLIDMYNWDVKNIKVLPARIDDSLYFSQYGGREDQLGVIKIAFISRIHFQKWLGFKYFIDSLVDVMHKYEDNRIVVDIYGDGPEKNKWEKYFEGNIKGNIQFNMKGSVILNSELLHNYSMVVTQGRGVLESIMSGIPVAISGENGYKGVVTYDNIDMYAKTNFTGRKMDSTSDLIDDIEKINILTQHYKDVLIKYVEDNYSVDKLTHELLYIINTRRDELISGSGNIVTIIYYHVVSILSAVKYRVKFLFHKYSLIYFKS